MRSLDGAVALVTGASSGIGLALAERLVAAGAHVVAADVADAPVGTPIRCDVTDPADSERAVALAQERHGGLDLVLLNAGVAQSTRSWDDLDLEAYRRVVGVNVDGVVFGLRAALPALRARGGGGVVVTASLAGLAPAPATPLYALSKAAVVGLVRSFAPPLATEGITLNAVCPGFVETPLLDGITERFTEAGFPLLPADDVAATALDLATGEDTGQCVVLQPGREPVPYAFRGVPGPRGVGEGVRPPTRYALPPGV